MAYSPYKPEPPVPVEHVPLLGLDNGVWRAAWFFAYVGMVLLAMPASRGACLWQHVMLHAWWWLGACYFAREVNGLVCELMDEEAQRAYVQAQQDHARALIEAMANQPRTGPLKRNQDTRDFDYERAPLQEPPPRPLIDKEMGVRVRN